MARKGTYSSAFTYDGKRYWAYGNTPEEAKINAKVKLAKLEANIKEYKNNVLVKDWAYLWLDRYKKGAVSTGWYKSIESTIRLRIIPAIGSKRVRDVKPIDISKMYNSFAGASDSVGNNLVQITRQIFEEAEANEITGRNPARNVKPPKFKPKGTRRAMTPEEEKLFLATCKKYPEDGLFFEVSFFTGLRPQEVAALRMKNYDKKNRLLYVEQARKADNSIGETKSRRGKRVVPVPDVLAEELDKIKKNPDEYLITAPKGGMYTRSAQIKLWARFKKAMEIENGAKVVNGVIVEPTLADDLVPYCCRHSAATLLAQDMEVVLPTVRDILGQSTDIADRVYIHRSEAAIEEARRKMNEHFNKKLK